MKTVRNVIFLILLTLGLVIAMVPENTTKPYKLDAGDMLDEVQYGAEMISAEDLAHWIISADPSIQLIDVRTPEEYATYHLDGAINIPFSSVLSDEYIDITDQDVKMNIFYSNGTLYAHQTWMILRQLGYENNYVLQGGLNHWFDTIMNPEAPPSTSADEEIARYEFQKGASGYFGGGAVLAKPAKPQTKANKPAIKRRPKKKAPEGGC